MGRTFKKYKYRLLSTLTFGKKSEYYKSKLQKYDPKYYLKSNVDIYVYSLQEKINNLQNQINILQYQTNNIPYEIFDKSALNNKNLLYPKVLSVEETINEIINNKKSICRYGDGEFTTMINKSDWKYFNQDTSFELINKLREIIVSDDENILVCLWDFFGDLSKYNDYHKNIARMHCYNIREDLYKYIDFNKVYGNAFMSRPYINLKNKEKSQYYFDLIRKIWDNQDIIIIEGEGSRLGVGNDLFDNVKSIQRVICPSENAYSFYDEILEYSQTLPKDKLILIALGMTATVLAYDLAKLGYWAIDIGHIDIEYEWYKRKAVYPIPIENKYVNEAQSTKITQLDDPDYNNSIIKTILKKEEKTEYTVNDIDIFVLTYNRCEFLKDSLASLLNQTVKNLNITVIDNASEDDTEEFMKKFSSENSNIHYYRNSENMGSEYSYNLAGMMAKRRLMMVFHDDDLLHPKYIETALAYFSKFNDLNILSTDCHTPDVMSNDKWEDVSTDAVFCKNMNELASFMYYEGTFAYPTVIYRTKNYKNIKFDKTPYGKIDDKIRCLEICKGGSAIVLKDNHFLRYRVHKGQDSSSSKNGPFYHEIINFNRYFKNILTSKLISQDNLLFMIRNTEWLEFCYYWGNDYSISIKNFVKKAYKEGAACLFTKLLYKKAFKNILRPMRRMIKNRLKPHREIVSLK